MTRIAGSTLFFAFTLLALAALGVWWTIFIERSVELERQATLDRLSHEARLAAFQIGSQAQAPRSGPIDETSGLEVTPCSRDRVDRATWPATPRHGSLCVGPTARRMAEVEARVHRRRVMVVGEGSLLFLLLAVCTVMLYRLVVHERRHLRDMERFVSALTHDMKTPVAGIRSLLQTFAAGKVPNEERSRLITLGLAETARLERSLENVLLSGSLRTNRHALRVEPVSLREAVDAVVGRFRTLARGADLVDTGALDEIGEIRTLADRGALEVILGNLVDNALKYGDKTTVTLTAALDHGHVSLSVHDDGMGFDARDSEALFEPLWRAPRVREEAHRGTGLGLYLARTLARRMHGDVTGHSDGPGKGSTFTLTLPAALERS
jgi:signal transduction histidine kinase